jgi:ectoine hydroxylase-related dioxygenase (phytanoyl-CoA dioxygenase family)
VLYSFHVNAINLCFGINSFKEFINMSPEIKTRLKGIKEKYDRDGYVVVKNVLDKDLIGEMRAHIDWLLEKNPGIRPEQLHHTLMVDDPFWLRVVRDDRLLDVAEQFIGPDIALFASHYICKPPRDGQAVLWHQDGSYWPLEPMEVTTLFLAVDHSTPQNGCMRVIPGTHALALQELQERHDVANVLESGLDESLVDESKAVDIVLEPGDVSIHHPQVIHGSNANRSDDWRRALTIRYIPTTTRVTDEDWPTVFHLRGKTVLEINQYRPYPRYVPGKHMPFRGCENWPPIS